MNLGLLDLPGLLLGPIDGALGAVGLPAFVRLVLWGVLAGAAGMWIYRRVSPQQRLGAIRTELADTRRTLAGYDGPFAGLLVLVRRQLALALTQMRLTFVAALLAGLPVLFVLPMLSNRHDAMPPTAGSTVDVCIEPAEVAPDVRIGAATFDARGCASVAWPSDDAPRTITEGATPLAALPLHAPSRVLHARAWWNLLVGNPAGYLPEGSRVEQVRFALPGHDVVPFGPAWLRGWEATFFFVVVLVSLLLHRRWKLQ